MNGAASRIGIESAVSSSVVVHVELTQEELRAVQLHCDRLIQKNGAYGDIVRRRAFEKLRRACRVARPQL